MKTERDQATRTSMVELVSVIGRLADVEGLSPTAWPELIVARAHQPMRRQQVAYKPCLCFIAQGRKRAYFGDRVVNYDPDNFLLVSLPLLIEAEIVEATVERPFLALVLEIDTAVVSQLILDLEEAESRASAGHREQPTMTTSRTSASIIQSATRLLRVIEDPVDRRVLGPAAVRELLYRVLSGEQGDALRALALRDSSTHRISRVLRFLEEHHGERLDIASIARAAGMSESTLHHTFKRVTSLSPIQYLKKVRLHRARLMLVNSGLNAGEAAFRVGYDSPSQFSREFKRLFGIPPSRAAESLPAPAASR